MAQGKPITKWCRHYFSKTGCERGYFCTFAHSEEALGKSYFDRGSYEASHKMVLCRIYAAGQPCKERCPFAHGTAELGKGKQSWTVGLGGKEGLGTRSTPRACESEWEAYPKTDGTWRWHKWQGMGVA